MSSVRESKIKEELLEWLADPEFKEVMKPYIYISATPGKAVRKHFAEFFNYITNVPRDKLHHITDLIMEFHQTTLLLDDIQDNSILRRCKPVAHKIYGIPKTLNTVNLLQYITLDKSLAIGGVPASTIVMNGVLECLKGQGMELYWRDNFICPTEEEYTLMARRKTGGPFVVSVQLLQLLGDNHNNVDGTEFGNLYGLYFQILDDYQNLTNEKYFKVKGFCEDITEGKFSFPIVHAVNNYPEEGARILDILKLRTDDVELKKQCLALLEKCGSLEYTRQKVEILKNDVKEMASKVGNLPNVDHFLDESLDALYMDGTL